MPRTSHASRPDLNKATIVSALRAIGASVTNLAGGQGVPDLLVGFEGVNTLLEVKAGRAKLNPEQEKLARRMARASVHLSDCGGCVRVRRYPSFKRVCRKKEMVPQ